MTKTIQIVCFNVPYPANYGGAIDVFYQIKALHSLGCKLILHCFCYRDFDPQSAIEELAEKVYYYPRDVSFSKHLAFTPFIVKSRINQPLIDNLNEHHSSILFQGTHTTGIIGDELIERIPKYVRSHNIESFYYARIASSEPNLLKRAYLLLESKKLRAYEDSLWSKGIQLIPISAHDSHYMSSKSADVLAWIPPFHPFSDVITQDGIGDHILIHGDFSIAENKKSAMSIVDEVVPFVSFPFVIAGKQASALLNEKRSSPANLRVESDVSYERMMELLQQAQVTITESQNSEGFKLKLLYGLFAGRHCVGNQKIVFQTTLQSLVHLVDNRGQMAEKLNLLIAEPWSKELSDQRRQLLFPRFDNTQNAKRLMEIIA